MSWGDPCGIPCVYAASPEPDIRARRRGYVGIGLLSCFMCREALERGELQRVLPKHEGPTATLYAVYPSGRYVPRRVIALRDFLVAGVARGT